VQEQPSYGTGARRFHWATVALLLVIIPIGLVMGDLPRGTLQNTFFITHESLGLGIDPCPLILAAWLSSAAPLDLNA
jgi:cytochrome b561